MDGWTAHRHVEKKMSGRASPPTNFVGGTGRQADPRGLILVCCSPGQCFPKEYNNYHAPHPHQLGHYLCTSSSCVWS